jgi:hypothetical protein
VGYESSVEVLKVANTFSEINIDSKYDKISFGLSPDLKYQLDADLKYGTVSYHEGLFDKIDRKEQGDQITIKAGLEMSGLKSKSVLKAYETDFILR